MARPTVVCIVGMGRAGSSLVSRVLNLLGVYLGPAEHIMGPAESNPRGHWESLPIVEVNDRILSAFGGSWHEPPTFPADWHRARELADIKERARAIIEGDFAGVDLWGWKDPRTSLTLPFWQDLLPPMRYVICLRNPVDVAHSLRRRDGFSLEKGGRLWLAYIGSSIAHTEGCARLFVFYEDLMTNWRQEIRRLAAFVDGHMPAEGSETLALIEDFIDGQLEHHRSSVAQALSESAIPYPTRALYLLVRKYVDEESRAPRGSGSGSEETERAINVFSQDSGGSRTPLDGLRAGLETLSRRLEEKEQVVSSLEKETARLKHELANHHGRLEALARQLSERERHVRGMEGSLSWRMTAPLRLAKQRMRRLFRRTPTE